MDGAKLHQTPHGVQRCQGGNSPVCCQGDTGVRSSPPCHPLVTAMARGTSSLFLTLTQPCQGAEQEADGDGFNEMGWSLRGPARGWVSPRGSSTPRCSGTPSTPGWSSASSAQGDGAAVFCSPSSPRGHQSESFQSSTGTRTPPPSSEGSGGGGIVLNPAPCPRWSERVPQGTDGGVVTPSRGGCAALPPGAGTARPSEQLLHGLCWESPLLVCGESGGAGDCPAISPV